MKAAYLVKCGSAEDAFDIREVIKPEPKSDQVLIKVEAFGLNFADIAARYGKYRGAPPYRHYWATMWWARSGNVVPM